MYLNYYGFREPPFELTSNPKYLFFTEQHREALTVLEYGLSSAKAVTVLNGVPAVGITVILELRQASAWAPIGRGITDENGRVNTLTTEGRLAPGTYRLTFDIGSFHREQGLSVSFFPEVKITFNVRDPDEHFHLPLLLSPFGYSTYRGSAHIPPPEAVNLSDDV